MKTMITHPFFGDFDGEYWEKTLMINGKPCEIVLENINDTSMSLAKLNQYADFIQNLTDLDKKARTFLTHALHDNDEFIRYYLDEMESYQDSEILSQFFASNQKVETFVDLLSLDSVSLYTDDMVILDYMIDPEVSDQILSLRVDLSGQILDLAWES